MVKAKEKIRIYNGSDADMIEASRVMHGLFQEDLSAFTNFDPVFSADFAAIWLSKINIASGIVNDIQPLGELSNLTRLVEEKLEECREYFQYVKYFIEKAFPGQSEMWTQFGLNDYMASRKSETKMIQLLGILYKGMIRYQTELNAVGLSKTKIEQASELQTQLTSVNFDQEIAKKKRPTLTQERITALNDCFEYMQKVSRAGKIIFAKDYAKYNQYLLPYERVSKSEKPAEETPAS